MSKLQWQQLGVPEASIQIGLKTMDSDRWIIGVEPSQVTMIDLQNGAQIVTCRPARVEAAIMNPGQNGCREDSQVACDTRTGRLLEMEQ